MSAVAPTITPPDRVAFCMSSAANLLTQDWLQHGPPAHVRQAEDREVSQSCLSPRIPDTRKVVTVEDIKLR